MTLRGQETTSHKQESRPKSNARGGPSSTSGMILANFGCDRLLATSWPEALGKRQDSATNPSRGSTRARPSLELKMNSPASASDCRRSPRQSHRLETRTTSEQNAASRKHLRPLALATMPIIIALIIIVVAAAPRAAQAQFLFTYEINSADDSRSAPKSSLFDPSSFKIVTPAQLQSTYQRLAGAGPPSNSVSLAPPAPEAGASAESSGELGGPSSEQVASPRPSISSGTSAGQSDAPPAAGLEVPGNEQPQSSTSASSFLKQTSAALQSFAELFHLTPTSSPPLGQRQAGSPAVDQQAEARSLHEHWTQEQQRAHSQSQQQPQIQSALQSFASTAPQVQVQAQPSSSTPASNPLSQHHPPQPASYWLTANPLTPPDGNFLVEVKQPLTGPTNEQQPASPRGQAVETATVGGQLMDNLLSLGQQQQQPQQQQQQQQPTRHHLGIQHAQAQSQPFSSQNHHHQHQPTTRSQQQQQQGPLAGSAAPAQNSFLATQPSVSFYPSSAPPSSPGSSQIASSHRQQQQSHQQQHLGPASAAPQSQPLHAHQARSLHAPPRQLAGRQQNFHTQSNEDPHQQLQLQPPANTPDNFNLASQTSQPLKSAEESLIAFRQEQQNAALVTQHQQHLQAQREHQRETTADYSATGVGGGSGPVAVALGVQDDSASEPRFGDERTHFAPHQLNQIQGQPKRPAEQKSGLGEIPKVSPQIYESFLLQRKDQFEKHMELLKQQQELNKLMEQKQKQQQDQQSKQQDSLRKRKKEELERQEARKKQSQAAREAQERERRRQLQLAEQEAAARKLRQLNEQRERERIEREEKARQEERARKQELLLERERVEAAERERREQQEAKLRSYLRQQEELRKLLELKQKEDEAAARRRQQAAAEANNNNVATQQQAARSVGNIPQRLQASRLAVEHRERASSRSQSSASSPAPTPAGVSSWGTPLRASRSRTTLPMSNFGGSSSTTTTTTISTTTKADYSPLSELTSAHYSSTPATQVSSTTTSSSATASGARSVRLHKNELKRQNVSQHQHQHHHHHQKQAADEKLIRQKIPLYSGAGKYGLYRASLGNDSTLAELAALLDSVTLPSSTTTSTTTTTTTTTTSTTTPAPDYSSTSSDSTSYSFNTNNPASSTISFDDDVPRRPTGTTTTKPLQTASQAPVVSRAARTPSSSSASNSTSSSRSSHTSHIGLASLPADSDNDGIPGRAGMEYPVLSEVPRTSFSCSKQPLNGYYADTETACQVVHLCQSGAQSSILCPNGTIFNQEKFSCQWWYEVNCSRAPNYYQLNDNLYKQLPGTARAANGPNSLEAAADLAATANSLKLKRTRTAGL